MPTYRILSFDGGGLRGLVSLVMLKRLLVQQPNLVASADLIAGTSTGGIIALGLAAGKTVDELIALYRDHGEEIFDDSVWDNLVDLGKLAGADYSNKNLARFLRREFGDRKLNQLGKRVLVPTFDLDNEHKDPKQRTWKPVFFHNFPGSDSDGKELVVDVALSTSAAPTFFPSYQGNIDGGVLANNPSMAALTQTQDQRAELNPRPALNELLMLSVGTGTVLSYVPGARHNWGFAQWAKPLINLLMDASMGIADYQCRQILQTRYHRLAPVFDPGVNIKLDDWKRIGEMMQFAEAVDLAPAAGWLQTQGW
jgi:patatin-like phospholipase/acyl hydrolase